MKPRYRVISTGHEARIGDVFKAVNGLWYTTAPEPYDNPCEGCCFVGASNRALCLWSPICAKIVFKEMK